MMLFLAVLLLPADTSYLQEYQKALLLKVFQNLKEDDMEHINLTIPFEDTRYVVDGPAILNLLQRPGNREALLLFHHGKLQEFQMIWWRNIEYAQFEIEFLPSSVVRTIVTNCCQMRELHMRALPRESQVISFRNSRFRGSIDLQHLPLKLQTMNLAWNDFSGKIFLGGLPGSLRDLDISSNWKLKQKVAYYDRLPNIIQFIDLSNTKIRDVCPIHEEFRANPEIFRMPKG